MTLQTLNNTRELAQQLRVGSVRRLGVVLVGRYLDELPLPARLTRRMGGPNDYAGGRRNSMGKTGSADRCHGGADHQPISAAGNELTGSTRQQVIWARNITLAARNDGGSESPGTPGV